MLHIEHLLSFCIQGVFDARIIFCWSTLQFNIIMLFLNCSSNPGSKFKTMETISCRNSWLNYACLLLFCLFVWIFVCLFVSFTTFYRIQYRILKNLGVLIIELFDILELRILTYYWKSEFFFKILEIELLDFEYIEVENIDIYWKSDF